MTGNNVQSGSAQLNLKPVSNKLAEIQAQRANPGSDSAGRPLAKLAPPRNSGAPYQPKR